MPGFDRTGPMGEGPMTGRGLGYCARPGTGVYAYGYNRRWFWPGRSFFGMRGPRLAWRHGWFGRGYNYGRGFGRGYGRGYGRGWW
ncbi:hypothetical protein AT15_05915 [Kosmotoga arenicorallina S304]|uniref:Uncharacterized protein n=1 Tax=Kosmotoga arenicorallina S304 TaxID=1453497 RepID=A0A176K3K8_9BACT|nr:DUF5320 domain-containing protein [Kosmotoga arenicorallina]OAA31606.1 hypothetical protein AT15_05915 [Kosmotoga arenicorallina S304]